MDSIIINNVSKNFDSKIALNKISLNINSQTFALLGRKRSGKTTLTKILATILTKSSGEITICGTPIEKSQNIRTMIGYLPQDFLFNANINVYEFMDYLGILSEIPTKIRKEKIQAVLKKVNLDDCYKLKVKSLSNGLKRRLGLAQSVLHDPKILIVDEPTEVLAPEERARFRTLLNELSKDKLVFIATSIVADIEKTCESIAILNNGEIAYSGLLKDFVCLGSSLEEAYVNMIGGNL